MTNAIANEMHKNAIGTVKLVELTEDDLKNAEWTHTVYNANDCPIEECYAEINGHFIQVGYCFNLEEGGCYVLCDNEMVLTGKDAEKLCKYVGKLTGHGIYHLTYEAFEAWADYHKLGYWEDMDEDKRWMLYENFCALR